MIGSFGASKGYSSPAFQLVINHEGKAAPASAETVRYGKLDEIHHIFRSDAESPPVLVSLVFTVMVLGTLPVLAGIVSFNSYTLDNCFFRSNHNKVVISRGQRQPSLSCIEIRPSSPRCLHRIARFSRGYLLLVLYKLEPFPNSASCPRRWRRRLPQWKPRTERGSRKALVWAEISSMYDLRW